MTPPHHIQDQIGKERSRVGMVEDESVAIRAAVYRCVCGELEQNRAHYDARLSGFHPYAGEATRPDTAEAAWQGLVEALDDNMSRGGWVGAIVAEHRPKIELALSAKED